MTAESTIPIVCGGRPLGGPLDTNAHVHWRGAPYALAVCVVLGGCVDTTSSPEEGGSGIPVFLDEPEPIELVETDPVPLDVSMPATTGPYVWENVVILGGGFVTGIVFSQAAPNLIYVRTDVGGAYRWNETEQRWVPLTDWMSQDESNWMGIESIAADPVEPGRVYMAAGTYLTAGNGVILSSTDFGKTWQVTPIAAPMGGNVDGRSMGERLAVDPNFPQKIYFGSRNQGLWVSADSAASFQRVGSFPSVGLAEQGLAFVEFDARSGSPGGPTPVVYVGVSPNGGEPTLYRSDDAGASFQAVPGAPTGLLPHHAALGSDGALYLAYNNGPGPNDITAGALWKLDTASGEFTNVTPPDVGACGVGGVSTDASRPDVVMISTIDCWGNDNIYRSMEGGRSWFPVLGGATRSDSGARWLYFGRGSLDRPGWMGDLEIDPWNRSRALHITGQGVWWSDDVTQRDAELATTWAFRNEGLEQTVPLDLASPPSGPPLLSALGDLAGFRHEDLMSSPPSGMFQGPIFGNTSSIDFAENDPAVVARVGTSSSRRGAYSVDGGRTWMPFATEPMASGGEGSIAVSADGTSFVWSPRGGGVIPAYSRDLGATWTACAGLSGSGRVASDRVNANRFYMVDRDGVHVSTDGGATFAPGMAGMVPRGARPRPVFGIEGDLWLVSDQGLSHSTDSGATFTAVPGVERAIALGFGMAAPEASYPALYLSGSVGGVMGLYRSDDAGETFVPIHDDAHRFGWVSHVAGDQRIYGRVYIGTGGRGVLFGDPR